MMILAFLALLCALVNLGFILVLWIGFNKLAAGGERSIAPVSIIVAMKNERQNVRSCLEALIHQTYPADQLEIVVVDDGSTDGTAQILADYQRRHSVLKVVPHDPVLDGYGGKKSALNKGIAESAGEILLFTDADCVPSPRWAETMASYFAPQVGLVAGFSPLLDPTDRYLGKLLLIDSLVNGVVAAGGIGLGSAVTCTGRNLAYRRQVFDQVNGFTDIMHSISGDDDLFLHTVHQKTDWKICFASDQNAIVPSYQSLTLKQLFRQKKRHLSAGRYYPFRLKLAYFVFHASNLLLYLLFLVSLLIGQNWLFTALLLMAKFLWDGLFIIRAGKIFQVTPAIHNLLAWEFLFILYHLIIAPCSWFGKIRWK